MPFTVDDFEDLLRLLYERPEWRQRLREMILPPELFELPRIAQELADANQAIRERMSRLDAEQHATRDEVRAGFTQTGERFDRVETRLEGVETRLDGVEGRLGHVETDLAAFRTETHERFNRVDQRFDRVDQRFDRVDQRFDQMDDRLGHIDARGNRTTNDMGVLKGNTMETRYRERARTYFSDFVAQPTALTVAEFDAFAYGEVEAGRLLPAEGKRLGRADLLVRGVVAGEPKYLVVEVSWSLDEEDVRRAADRAALLRKAGYDAQGIVAGWRIEPDALTLAERIGVGRVIEREMDGHDPTGGEDDEP